MSVMNKQEIVDRVAGDVDMAKAQVLRVLEGILEEITKSLKKGGEVRLMGFGSFSVTRRKATRGRNPKTGEEIKIPASNRPKFKAGKALKEAVN